MLEPDSSSSCVSSTSSPSIGDISHKKDLETEIEGNYKIKKRTSEESTDKSIYDDAPEQSNKLSSTEPLLSNAKGKGNKICGVCGDVAKSFHFGGLSCDSCKAFFRRSVQNDAYVGFKCGYGSSCAIDKSSRKTCQYCRFHKCLSIGMEKNWVMSEDERNQLKLKKEKKQETPATSQVHKIEKSVEEEYEPDVSEMLKFMSGEERDEIECIVNKYQHSYREMPFKVSKTVGSRNSIEIIQMFTTILRRFAYFAKLFPEFTTLSPFDQSSLLRASVLEMCLLRGALSFDMKNNRWPKTENMDFLKDCPQLRVEDMEKLVSKDLYEMHMQFINSMQELGADEPVVTILLLIVLFYPERGNLENQDYISSIQEKYLILLNKYVNWRYGSRGTKTFPKLLTKLADLRQLNDSHTEYNLRMSKNEVEKIQEQLGNLNLNPYPQWVIVEDKNKPNSSTHVTPNQNEAMEQNLSQSQSMAQDFFIQFVNKKIPALITNPFTPFSMDNELAFASSFFPQNTQGAMPHMGNASRGMNPSQNHPNNPLLAQINSSQSHANPLAQFKEILETADPNALRQLKDSLPHGLVTKLQSVFGSSSSEGSFDMSRIPPELINNYMSSGGMMSNMSNMSNIGSMSENNMSHPMAQYNESQMREHFTQLQQQFMNPNYFHNYNSQQVGYDGSYYPTATELLAQNNFEHTQLVHDYEMSQEAQQYNNINNPGGW